MPFKTVKNDTFINRYFDSKTLLRVLKTSLHNCLKCKLNDFRSLLTLLDKGFVNLVNLC